MLKAYETLTKIDNQLSCIVAMIVGVERTKFCWCAASTPSPNHPNGGIEQRGAHSVLGHPQRDVIVSTTASSRGEYWNKPTGHRSKKTIRSSSFVGRGQNKWVTRRTSYTPWNKKKHATMLSGPNTAEQSRGAP